MGSSGVVELPVKPFRLSHGSHGAAFTGCACASELASVLVGARFSYAGVTIAPMVNDLQVRLNDIITGRYSEVDQESLDRLLRLVPRGIGTLDDGRDEERKRLCAEWLLQKSLPRWVELAGEPERAAVIRALPPDLALENVARVLEETRSAMVAKRRVALDGLRERVREAVREELEKRGWPGAVGAAVAVDAAVAAVAVGAVDAADAAVAVGHFRRVFREKFWELWRPKIEEKTAALRAEAISDGLDLLEALVNGEDAVREDLIVVPHWRIVCGWGQG